MTAHPPLHPPPRLLITVLALAALLAWDASGLDLPLARLFGDAAGFALRDHWLLGPVMHEGGRLLGWLGALMLCLGVWWPRGPLRRLARRQRLQLAVSTLAAALAVSVLKGFSSTSCPQELAMFGRSAQYLSHWRWPGLGDGGSGHCFPAGHASAGFSFISGWFAFRRMPSQHRLADRWLMAALAAGLLLGVAQQARGAHFMSHTLWSAWLCWLVAWGLDGLFNRRPRGVPAPACLEPE